LFSHFEVGLSVRRTLGSVLGERVRLFVTVPRLLRVRDLLDDDKRYR
jgi:hypothetical protein